MGDKFIICTIKRHKKHIQVSRNICSTLSLIIPSSLLQKTFIHTSNLKSLVYHIFSTLSLIVPSSLLQKTLIPTSSLKSLVDPGVLEILCEETGLVGVCIILLGLWKEKKNSIKVQSPSD